MRRTLGRGASLVIRRGLRDFVGVTTEIYRLWSCGSRPTNRVPVPTRALAAPECATDPAPPARSHQTRQLAYLGARAGYRHGRGSTESAAESLLVSILLAAGFSAYQVAPGTITATLLTSLTGVITHQILQLAHTGAIAPDWALGAWIGAGGFAGSYLGARLQQLLPETSIRRLLGLVACVIAARYTQQAMQDHTPPRASHATAP